MEYIFTYLLLALIVILGITFSKSKIIKFLVIIIIFSLICFSEDSNDYWVYTYNYNLAGTSGDVSYEVVWKILWSLGNKYGLDYYHFRIFLSIIELCVLDFIICRLTIHTTFVWTLYLVYSAIYDAFLMRHFLSSILIIAALSLLYKKDRNKFDILICISLIITSGMSHSSFWYFFLMIPLSYLSDKKKIIVTIIIATMIYSTVAIELIFKLYSLLPIRTFTLIKYEGNYANIKGIIFDWCIQFIYILPVIIINVIRKKRKDNTQNISLDSNDIVNSMTSLNISFCSLIPFQYFSVNFSRLQRILAFENYIYLSNLLSDSTKKQKMIKIFTLGYAELLLFISMFVISKTNIENVWNAHFNTNELLNFLKF